MQAVSHGASHSQVARQQQAALVGRGQGAVQVVALGRPPLLATAFLQGGKKHGHGGSVWSTWHARVHTEGVSTGAEARKQEQPPPHLKTTAEPSLLKLTSSHGLANRTNADPCHMQTMSCQGS